MSPCLVNVFADGLARNVNTRVSKKKYSNEGWMARDRDG